MAATEDQFSALIHDLETRAAKELKLEQALYPLREAAELLHISRSRLSQYMHMPQLNITALKYEASNTQYLLAADIKKIWMVRHQIMPVPKRKWVAVPEKESQQAQSMIH